MQLEKELDREEREAMERFIQTEDGKKQDKVGQLTNGLTGQLQGIVTLLNKFCYIELVLFLFFFFFTKMCFLNYFQLQNIDFI